MITIDYKTGRRMPEVVKELLEESGIVHKDSGPHSLHARYRQVSCRAESGYRNEGCSSNCCMTYIQRGEARCDKCKVPSCGRLQVLMKEGGAL